MEFEINDISDDEDIQEYLNHLNRERRVRVMHQRIDHLNLWNDSDFFARFRLTKPTVHILLQLVEENIRSNTERNDALTPAQMLLLTLRFYATGSFLIVIGELMGVHYSTASKVVHKVSHAIASLRQQFINMPTNNEDLATVRQQFYNIARFPRCIGAIDCTHIKLQSPGGDEAEIYRNRKQYFSLNVQTICDATLQIRDIVARWPGSSHDSTIFHNSAIHARFEDGEFGNNLIVGDSGYANNRYMVTPLANPQTPSEHLFQEAQIRTRNPIERSYGMWKRRFPCLAMGLRIKLERVQAVIVATAILHNLAIRENEAVPHVDAEQEEQIDLGHDVPVEPVGNAAGNPATRENLINQYFQQLINNNV